MIRAALLAAALAVLPTPAPAQSVTSGPAAARKTINPQLVQLLQDGFEIKAAFAEAGVAYLLLQKTTSAFLCRSGGNAPCEKLN